MQVKRVPCGFFVVCSLVFPVNLSLAGEPIVVDTVQPFRVQITVLNPSPPLMSTKWYWISVTNTSANSRIPPGVEFLPTGVMSIEEAASYSRWNREMNAGDTVYGLLAGYPDSNGRYPEIIEIAPFSEGLHGVVAKKVSVELDWRPGHPTVGPHDQRVLSTFKGALEKKKSTDRRNGVGATSDDNQLSFSLFFGRSIYPEDVFRTIESLRLEPRIAALENLLLTDPRYSGEYYSDYTLGRLSRLVDYFDRIKCRRFTRSDIYPHYYSEEVFLIDYHEVRVQMEVAGKRGDDRSEAVWRVLFFFLRVLADEKPATEELFSDLSTLNVFIEDDLAEAIKKRALELNSEQPPEPLCEDLSPY